MRADPSGESGLRWGIRPAAGACPFPEGAALQAEGTTRLRPRTSMGDTQHETLCGIGRLGRRNLRVHPGRDGDRKSTRLNSSHANISYAVFCLKKKITTITPLQYTS